MKAPCTNVKKYVRYWWGEVDGLRNLLNVERQMCDSGEVHCHATALICYKIHINQLFLTQTTDNFMKELLTWPPRVMMIHCNS